jgi:PIN domain nuclease of toxin-antitoxin system
MTGLLLDTHAALWWWREVQRLSATARDAIETSQEIYVSAASAFEIGQKWRLGKLAMIDDPAENFPRLMAENRFLAISLTDAHTLTAGLLPGDHRDPFDRLIAAQALAEGLTVVTRDPQFAAFGCKVLW